MRPADPTAMFALPIRVGCWQRARGICYAKVVPTAPPGFCNVLPDPSRPVSGLPATGLLAAINRTANTAKFRWRQRASHPSPLTRWMPFPSPRIRHGRQLGLMAGAMRGGNGRLGASGSDHRLGVVAMFLSLPRLSEEARECSAECG